MNPGPQSADRDGLYLGLISGTSMDGVDAALVEFGQERMSTVAAATSPYPPEVRRTLVACIEPLARMSLHDIGTLNIVLGRCFADAAIQLLDQQAILPTRLVAIGSHGQTLRHSPDSEPPYSMQLGDPATIATRTGVTTVAAFRSMDIAAGGEGAPLVPAFHERSFRTPEEDRVVLNVGGIANLSCLPAAANTPISGYDTGPGNCLLDVWCQTHMHKTYDDEGAWAASGSCHEGLLESFLSDAYFARPAPKSTGRETFNLHFVRAHLDTCGLQDLAAANVQATLMALTVLTISRAITAIEPTPKSILVCGGGARNGFLMQALAREMPDRSTRTTAALGVDPDFIEAAAFAWFAKERVEQRPIRLTTHGAARALTLGAVYEPTR